MPDVKTPFGGIPRWVVWGVVIGGGGGLIYAYVKNKNKKNTATQTAGNVYGYGTNTGAYGAYGYGAYTYQPYGYGYGPFGLGAYGGEGQYGYGYYGGGVPVQVPQQATTNAEWSQAAVSALTAQGYSGTQVLTALGAYLTGNQVTQDEKQQVIDPAIAAEGYPPVAGPNGYPPAVKTGGNPPGQSSKVTVPDVKGLDQQQAIEVIRSEGLKPVSKKAVPGRVLEVTGTNPPAGASVNKGASVTILSKLSPKPPGWRVGGRNEQ